MNRQEPDKDTRSNRISLQGGSSPAISVMSNNPLPAIRPSNAHSRSGADARVGSDRCNRIAASSFAKQILARKSANTHFNDFTAIKQKSVSRGKGGGRLHGIRAYGSLLCCIAEFIPKLIQ